MHRGSLVVASLATQSLEYPDGLSAHPTKVVPVLARGLGLEQLAFASHQRAPTCAYPVGVAAE